jgi:hypothetical protein
MSMNRNLMRCAYCETRLQGAAPTLADPVWRLYCRSCESTLVLPVRRYPSLDSVSALFTQMRLPLVVTTLTSEEVRVPVAMTS